jgi:hypothetical protein
MHYRLQLWCRCCNIFFLVSIAFLLLYYSRFISLHAFTGFALSSPHSTSCIGYFCPSLSTSNFFRPRICLYVVFLQETISPLSDLIGCSYLLDVKTCPSICLLPVSIFPTIALSHFMTLSIKAESKDDEWLD